MIISLCKRSKKKCGDQTVLKSVTKRSELVNDVSLERKRLMLGYIKHDNFLDRNSEVDRRPMSEVKNANTIDKMEKTWLTRWCTHCFLLAQSNFLLLSCPQKKPCPPHVSKPARFFVSIFYLFSSNNLWKKIDICPQKV